MYRTNSFSVEHKREALTAETRETQRGRREKLNSLRSLRLRELCVKPLVRYTQLTIILLTLFFSPTKAQTNDETTFRPDIQRALTSRAKEDSISRPRAGTNSTDPNSEAVSITPQTERPKSSNKSERRPARPPAQTDANQFASSTPSTEPTTTTDSLITNRIRSGTPLSRVLHTSQLKIDSTAGINLQLVDQTGNLEADERTIFDSDGGSFDIALGRSGTRYEVFSATDNRGTPSPSDDIPIGVLVVASDTNGDFVRDSMSLYNLQRDFRLPSAASVVSGTSRAGREFVIVSSSGYYNDQNPRDPYNEETAGVVLLVRNPATGGFDNSLSRQLVRVGSNQILNANALALLPNNDLLIADFDSNRLRIVRDTNQDGIPDTLDQTPYYSYRYSNDAPLDIAVNSRGVIFSHSYGNDTVLLAIYDENGDGRGDVDEEAAEGLSFDNNLFFHGLTVDRAGTVYVIEDSSGKADRPGAGGNGGTPRIDAFPDPALNGILRDGSLFTTANDPARDALSGLAFGIDTIFGPVGRLRMTNSASMTSNGTRDGLATIIGTNLTRGASGGSEAEAAARGLRISIEGRNASVLSFSDSQINIHVPSSVATGTNSVAVSIEGNVTAADDVAINAANPGLFTMSQTGAGEAIALLTSGMRYTVGPFPTKFNNQPSVIALLGTGWRNSLPVTVRIGGRIATVQYAGQSGFNGMDQINITIPDGLTTGPASVIITTANGATSRSDVFVTVGRE